VLTFGILRTRKRLCPVQLLKVPSTPAIQSSVIGGNKVCRALQDGQVIAENVLNAGRSAAFRASECALAEEDL